MPGADDQTRTIAELTAQVRRFVQERDWDQYHLPKDLALALSIEAAEVLEHFRFRSDAEVADRLQDDTHVEEIGHELADVLYFVLLMYHSLGLDAAKMLDEKLAISGRRYPVDKAKGRNLKYTELNATEPK